MPGQSTNQAGAIFGSNNAPLPIPGGYGNPAGGNVGQAPGATSILPGITPFTNHNTLFPSMGTPAGVPAFSANAGPFSATNMGGTSSGISGSGLSSGVSYDGLLKEMTRAYGKGTGSLLASILQKGLYNPSVAAAELNAQQPGINQQTQALLGSFSGAGARYSSAASLGLGNYLSQVQLNQQSTLANMYQNAQNEQMSILQGVLPTLHTEQANHGSNIVGDILGAAEIAGGVALTVATGGVAANAGASLVESGVGSIENKPQTPQAPGVPGGAPPAGSNAIQAIMNMIKAKSASTNIGAGGNSAGGQQGGGIGSDVPSGGISGISDPNAGLQISAGADIGGNDPYSSNVGISNTGGQQGGGYGSGMPPNSIDPYARVNNLGLTTGDTSDPQMQNLIQMLMQSQVGSA